MDSWPFFSAWLTNAVKKISLVHPVSKLKLKLDIYVEVFSTQHFIDIMLIKYWIITVKTFNSPRSFICICIAENATVSVTNFLSLGNRSCCKGHDLLCPINPYPSIIWVAAVVDLKMIDL